MIVLNDGRYTIDATKLANAVSLSEKFPQKLETELGWKADENFDSWISVVQIPHHGSYKNYHTDLSWSGSISVISTGFRYSHPSQKVVEEIKSQDSICAIVSYDKSTQIIQQIPLEYVVEEFYPELAL